MKNKHKSLIATLISVIVFLGIVCVVSITYNFYGGFYFSRIVQFDKILGEEQTISVDGVGVYMVACNFSGTSLLDVDIRQVVNIKTSQLDNSLYLRGKIEVVGKGNSQSIMFGTTNWFQGEDGYLYFNQQISSNENVSMCKYVKLSPNLKLESNVNYILVFMLECSTEPYNW